MSEAEIGATLVPCEADGERTVVAVTECLGRVGLGLSVGVSRHFTPGDARRLAGLLIAHADLIEAAVKQWRLTGRQARGRIVVSG